VPCPAHNKRLHIRPGYIGAFFKVDASQRLSLFTNVSAVLRPAGEAWRWASAELRRYSLGRIMKGTITKIQSFYISSSVILAAPLLYAIHVLEESFGFPKWVSTNFSVGFTNSQFRRNNFLFLAISMLLSFVTYRFPHRIIIFFFLTWLSGLFFHNALFHIGGTIYFQDFSPGLVSSVIFYIPLSLLFMKLVLREGLLNRQWIIVALIMGGIAHYFFIIGELSGWDFFEIMK
jgi:hypothetical protein